VCVCVCVCVCGLCESIIKSARRPVGTTAFVLGSFERSIPRVLLWSHVTLAYLFIAKVTL